MVLGKGNTLARQSEQGGSILFRHEVRPQAIPNDKDYVAGFIGCPDFNQGAKKGKKQDQNSHCFDRRMANPKVDARIYPGGKLLTQGQGRAD
jgi:hypothetical protein